MVERAPPTSDRPRGARRIAAARTGGGAVAGPDHLVGLKALAEAAPATARLMQLQGLADGGPLQLKPPRPGGNPKGRGGRGKYQRPKNVARGSDNAGWINEQRRRQERPLPAPMTPEERLFADLAARQPRGGGGVRPANAGGAPPQPGPGPVPGPVNAPARVRPADRDRARADRQDSDSVIIDIGEVDDEQETAPRSFGQRIGDKLFEGRTFSDTANTLGGAAHFSGDIAGAGMSIVAGSAVLVSGLKEFYRAVTARPGSAAELREAIYTDVIGCGDIYSGLTAILAGALTLQEVANGAKVGSVASLAGMAVAEATNILQQVDQLLQLAAQPRGQRNPAKALASLLASMLKCIGCLTAIGGEEDAGMIVMLLGTSLGVLHGVVKLILVCRESLGDEASQDDDGNGPTDPGDMV